MVVETRIKFLGIEFSCREHNSYNTKVPIEIEGKICTKNVQQFNDPV